ncbi:hypothetical protein J2S43_005289 [Catenuloplanes nepalensis]|uniref:Uncharacterized protein n=1 Tax=Catenuloplanes nepalensis TaxID=587533 RepID=A0ABT9MZA2_9ACTN|nr:hypothetical protein [Catenuloplanes nepalensis]MDP9796777.1 hypothetical protein [Catenuloplanes nepalensis]
MRGWIGVPRWLHWITLVAMSGTFLSQLLIGLDRPWTVAVSVASAALVLESAVALVVGPRAGRADARRTDPAVRKRRNAIAASVGFGLYLVVLFTVDSLPWARWAPVPAGLMLAFVVGTSVRGVVMRFVNRSRAERGRRRLEAGRGEAGGTLVLRRGGVGEVGFLRRMKVTVDRDLVAMLAYRGEVSMRLASGEYEVSAQLDWFHGGPLRIVVNEGETVAVRLSTEMPADLGFELRRDVIRVERE